MPLAEYRAAFPSRLRDLFSRSREIRPPFARSSFRFEERSRLVRDRETRFALRSRPIVGLLRAPPPPPRDARAWPAFVLWSRIRRRCARCRSRTLGARG